MIVLFPQPKLLTDPFLQLPTENSVRVVWFTEFPGSRHFVSYGENIQQKVAAKTTKLSRTREDKNSRVGEQTSDGTVYQKPTQREIWRHEAEVTNLTPGVRVPYQVSSITNQGGTVKSEVFSLAAKPQAGTPLKILLTSDHQLKPLTAANLQKVVETIDNIDAVFLAGDLINIPDRASEWFDDNRGGAFFPLLQGRGNYQLEKNGVVTTYKGGSLIQNVPLFPAIGNHEVMGKFSTEVGLNEQFNNPYPRQAAEKIYQQNQQTINPENKPEFQTEWIKNNTFNSDTYTEIFTLPNENKNYYSVTFGDIRLVSLYITNIWRNPGLNQNIRGKYRERDQDFNQPENWGYGQHIFEPIKKGSEQYQWLQQELNSAEFKQAKYKIVMFHHPPHSLGDNILPAYTDPVQIIDRDEAGNIQMIRYEYPKSDDYIIRDVMPLLEQANVQFVYYGHSHLWNRFVSESGIHFLESSNVGNTYGAYLEDKRRFIPPGFQIKNYSAVGDPNNLEPVIPNLRPILSENGQPLPYIASNDVTAFSIFDTATGTVSSYYFDTRKPDSEVVKFDEFVLKP
ncbi:calcineurin-like phosphoesterase family protein [Lyngbya aestuarii BL J]|uniref:Calcineurin-like phosphoesterase family protein n=1 Tax=Lyngbya aestuarii BL J TaxID=1348334 RepID=U7QGC6_9CYAN|nr:metallophosphoesterase family protein [Lyngbya aestuarii]ERT06337.1 calcineurin-like phosphoesterase family protein [Lyngbya aestuarii BL J]